MGQNQTADWYPTPETPQSEKDRIIFDNLYYLRGQIPPPSTEDSQPEPRQGISGTAYFPNGFTIGSRTFTGLTIKDGRVVSVTLGNPPAGSTNAASPTSGGTTLTPAGIPSSGTPIPAGTPVVSSLPNPATSTVGQTVIFNGLPFTFTADPSGGPTGFWAQSVSASVQIYDTHANRASYPATNYSVGTVYYETDTTVSYMVQSPAAGKAWLYYNGIYINTLANIPTYLGVNDKNFTFDASDYVHIWVWSGSAWNFALGSSGLYAAGSYASFAAPAFVPAGLWHAADGGTYAVAQNDATLTNVVTPNVSGSYLRR